MAQTLSDVTHEAALAALKYLQAVINDPATEKYERREAAFTILNYIKVNN